MDEIVDDPAQPPADRGEEAASGPLLSVNDLRVRFRTRGRNVFAVNGVDLAVYPGKTLAIIGESGSGKTVMSRAILGLLPSYATVTGSVRYDGRELLGLSDNEFRQIRGPHIAMIFQDSGRSLNPTMQVGEQIAETIRTHTSISRKAAKARALELLHMVRLPAAEQRYGEYPHQLSGGMRQRVMTAIALSCNPNVLIADEATTALDVTTQALMMELFLELQAEFHMALVVISHDMGIAASYTDEVIVLYGGRVVEQASTERLFESVRMPYSRVLLDAVPRLDREAHSRMPVVLGRPPDLTSFPTACSFAPRCTFAQDRCREELPPLEEGEPDHSWACFFPLDGEATE